MASKESIIQEAREMLGTGSSIEQVLGRIAYQYGQQAREYTAKQFRLAVIRDSEKAVAQ